MKVNNVETELPRMGLFRRKSPGVVAELVKRLRTRHHQEENLSYWQFILLQSKANGCLYRGENLPVSKWDWPKNTWLRERLDSARH